MTSKPVFELKNTTYRLSIQLSLNGFSFCITNSEGKIIATVSNFSSKEDLTEQELKHKLVTAFDTKPELQAQFTHVTVIYTNDLYCFVPKQFYNDKHKEVYFKYSIKTLATDFISADELSVAPIINLFIPYININNYLIERFTEFEFLHSSGLLVNYLLQKEALETDPKIYLHFYAKHFDIIVTKGKELLLCNTYINQSNEDVLYYLLFAMEQLKLSPQEVEVKLLNTIENELYELLYTYIKNMSTSKTDTLIHRLVQNV